MAIQLSRAWHIHPHALFDVDDDTLATMIDLLEEEANEQNSDS